MAMLVGRMGVANIHAAPKQERKQLRMNRREAAAEADAAEEAKFWNLCKYLKDSRKP